MDINNLSQTTLIFIGVGVFILVLALVLLVLGTGRNAKKNRQVPDEVRESLQGEDAVRGTSNEEVGSQNLPEVMAPPPIMTARVWDDVEENPVGTTQTREAAWEDATRQDTSDEAFEAPYKEQTETVTWGDETRTYADVTEEVKEVPQIRNWSDDSQESDAVQEEATPRTTERDASRETLFKEVSAQLEQAHETRRYDPNVAMARMNKARDLTLPTVSDFFTDLQETYEALTELRSRCDEGLTDLRQMRDRIVEHVVAASRVPLGGEVEEDEHESAANTDVRARAVYLHNEGRSREEISQALGIPEDEVDLIVRP